MQGPGKEQETQHAMQDGVVEGDTVEHPLDILLQPVAAGNRHQQRQGHE